MKVSSASLCGRALAALVAVFIVLSALPMAFAEVDNQQPISETAGSVKAYPGAEGYGEYSTGGRGGEVYHVTNLNSSGEGSLTYGIENVSGARTVVFDVGGVIDLTNLERALELKGENGSNITIAGQTAPYPGITIKGHGFDIEKAHDVIIRDLRVRIGGVREDGEYYTTNSLSVNAAKRVIIDHCSFQWPIKNNFIVTGEDITISNTIFDKPLSANSPSENGAYTYGGIFNEGARKVTFSKNFIGDSTQRSPRITDANYVDSYNCLLYNCGNGYDMFNYEMQNKNVKMNVYNNYARMGPSLSNGTPYRAGRGRVYSGGVMTYFAGNYEGNANDSKPSKVSTALNYKNTLHYVLNFGQANSSAGEAYDLSNVTLDEWDSNLLSYNNEGRSSTAATLTYMNYPFAAPRGEVMDVVAEDGSNNIVNYALSENGMGATRPARDLYDTMIMKEMELGGTWDKNNPYSLKASLSEEEITPFFEELERRTGLDYSEYKTAREWYVKQGEGPTLTGAETYAGMTRPVRWDDHTDTNVNNPDYDAANKYDEHYTTTFEVGDWWGEYCGAPGQTDGKYIAVSRTVADLYPDEWMQNDYPDAAAAMNEYRTDNYIGQADSAQIVWDTAGDGIPDWYKQYRGLEINTDYSKTVDSQTGYTYLEEYLAFMAGDTEPELPPVSIENFKANSIGYSAAQVFWNTDCRAKCTIEYGTEPGNYTESKTLTYDGVSDEFDTYHSVQLDKLSAATQYYYKVTATDENGLVSTAEYDASGETKSAMTFTTSSTPATGVLPSQPVITELIPSIGQVEVKWSGSTDDEGYEIYYDTEDHGADYTMYPNKVENIGARENSCTVTGLTDETRYYFVAAAVNINGRSTSEPADAVPGRMIMRYDFSQMSDAELTEFINNSYYFNLGGTFSVQTDPDTGKNVLQILDESNAYKNYIDFELPEVQSSEVTFEIKVKKLYQKQGDVLNRQPNIAGDSMSELDYMCFGFLEDAFAGDGTNSASDLYIDAFKVFFISESHPKSMVDGRIDGTTETGEISLINTSESLKTPIGTYLPGRTQGTSFEGERVLPEGRKCSETKYKYTTVYGDACYTARGYETDYVTWSVWYYEKGSAEYVTYKAVVNPASGTVNLYADGELLYSGEAGDFDNVGKIRIELSDYGYSWTNIENISIYAGEDDPTPSASPTTSPSASPIVAPSASPTATPSASPTAEPSASPTAEPVWSIKGHTDKDFTITAPSNAVKGAYAYVAYYKNGTDILENIEIIPIPIESGKTEYVLTPANGLTASEGDSIRIMIWDENFRPLCDAAKI